MPLECQHPDCYTGGYPADWKVQQEHIVEPYHYAGANGGVFAPAVSIAILLVIIVVTGMAYLMTSKWVR